MNKYHKMGFTLVEVIIAIAVLSVFIFPLTGMFMTSYKYGESARINEEAYAVANRVIEGMDFEDLSLSCTNEPLNAFDYNKYNISNAFLVSKTIILTENDIMTGIANIDDLIKNGKLLIINAKTAGEIKLTNALISSITYIQLPLPDKTEITITFNDSGTDCDGDLISAENFEHIMVLGGGNLNLILDNLSGGNKTLYKVKTESDSDFSVATLTAAQGKWTIYDNYNAAEKSDTGSVATADIIINVKHKNTGDEFSVETKRVFYKYEI